jgi:hypothetical protein
MNGKEHRLYKHYEFSLVSSSGFRGSFGKKGIEEFLIRRSALISHLLVVQQIKDAIANYMLVHPTS